MLLFLIGRGLRLHAAAVGHRAAKQRVDPHVRIGRRHHAVLAQPVCDDPGGGVRRDHPVRREPDRRREPSASIPSRASSTSSSRSPRASRWRSPPCCCWTKSRSKPSTVRARHTASGFCAILLRRERRRRCDHMTAPCAAGRKCHGFEPRIAVCRISACARVCLAPAAGHAQAKYPDRPVKVVVGFTAGGGTDVAGARDRAEALRGDRPELRGREPARRQRTDRLRAGRQVAGRRLHHHGRQPDHARGRARALQKIPARRRPRSSPAWR